MADRHIEHDQSAYWYAAYTSKSMKTTKTVKEDTFWVTFFPYMQDQIFKISKVAKAPKFAELPSRALAKCGTS